LGGASIAGADAPIAGPAAQRHRLALLALLVGAQPGGMSRDKLVAYLWPERDASNARNLLKQGVHALRRALGDEAIVAAGDELRLDASSVRSDVTELEAAAARGDHERVVELYRGPFLDGFFLKDSPEFERWVDRERARLADAYAKSLETLATDAETRGDLQRATDSWKALAAHAPFDSRLAARLMRALEASGNRAGALHHADLHERLLAAELGVAAAPEVVAERERLRREAVVGQVLDDPVEAVARTGSPHRDLVDSAGTSQSLGSSPLPDAALQPLRGARSARRWIPAVVTAVGIIAALGILVSPRFRPPATPPVAASTRAAADAKTVAVLPFLNLSRDPADEYLSDGLTEEVIGALAQVRSLRVVARTSAFAFKGDDRDIREIGRALGAQVLLEGSVRRDGDRVRVTAQLINAADGLHLWSHTYDRQATDLFAIQSDVAARIASALEAEVTPDDRARLARRPTENPAAHADYLKGRYFWNQRTRAGFDRAIEYFERAIAADSDYAAPHAGLAMVYSLQGLSGYLLPEEAKRRMRDAAQKAVDLDNGNAEAHAALGAYLNVHEWNSDASERAYRRAIELDPAYGTARHLYSNLLRTMGRTDDALDQKRRALQLDPLVPAMSEALAFTLVDAGRPGEALEHIRNAIELDSTFWRGYATLGFYYEATGKFDSAIREYERAIRLGGASTTADAGLARNLALAGRPNDARVVLDRLRTEAARTGVHAPGVAGVFLALDDVDGAVMWLERSYAQRHPQLRLMGHRAAFGRLGEDARFVDLMRRVGVVR
jgi:serine/threonine-protein kinase